MLWAPTDTREPISAKAKNGFLEIISNQHCEIDSKALKGFDLMERRIIVDSKKYVNDANRNNQNVGRHINNQGKLNEFKADYKKQPQGICCNDTSMKFLTQSY